jgi:hypothetical protein
MYGGRWKFSRTALPGGGGRVAEAEPVALGLLPVKPRKSMRPTSTPLTSTEQRPAWALPLTPVMQTSALNS